jgi:serine/threonine-protein kinase
MNLQTLGRYEIRHELGRGGMAIVYLGYDPRIEREVAIKVLPRQFSFDPQFEARFEQEVRAIAKLEHGAIVPVYDFGEVDDQPFIVMRYMSGGSLAARLRLGHLPLPEAARILTRIAPALDRAHAQGIIHRDLKPGNILFDQEGEAYLSDFGIAKLADSTAAYTGSALIGTPAYMSPEQARGEAKVDGRSDVYSLGVILFETLAGRPPYAADTPMGIAMRHVTDPIPRIRRLNPGLPKDLERVIRRALAKAPRNRFQTAAELASALTPIEAGTSPVGAKWTPPIQSETLVGGVAPPDWSGVPSEIDKAGPAEAVQLPVESSDRSKKQRRLLLRRRRPPRFRP